jgi:acetyltransferase-like isoleucine patch superfamily enzyme
MVKKRTKKSEEISKLYNNLQILHNELRDEMKKNWGRVLPFDELLFDRWEKANFLRTKMKASVYHNSYIYGDVEIGKKTWIGPYTLLDGSGGKLKIGDFCSVSSGTHVYTHDTVKWSVTGSKAPYEKKGTTVGDFCYVGPYTIITKGVRIGKCCVIGAHSLVNSNLPAYSLAFGTPARVVGKVEIKGKNVKYHFFEHSKKT